LLLKSPSQRIGKIWNFSIFTWNFVKMLPTINTFFSIVVSKMWQNFENLTREFWETRGQRKTFTPPPHAISTYRSGAPKFCTLVVTNNIFMPTEFWAHTLSFVQCWLVMRLPCDDLTVWWHDSVKKMRLWRVDRVTGSQSTRHTVNSSHPKIA